MTARETLEPGHKDAGYGDPLRIVGTKLGAEARYRVTQCVGGGGFAWIYEGIDQKFEASDPASATVAIKLMKGGSYSASTFEREARLMRHFKHPSVVEVYDYGIEEDGFAWLVMEYLPGISLKDLLERYDGRLPDRLIRKFVEELAPALQQAHDRELVHRDLKPHNVMLVHHGEPGEHFKLLDFGIASKIDAKDSLANETMRGAGTPEYMSPEQMRAGAEQDASITQKSDIYTFGVILYQLMTGRVPFPLGGNSMAAFARCCDQIQNAPPPPFADVAPDRPIRPQLEELIHACLAKQPKDRPSTMTEVRQRFMDAFTVEPPAPWWHRFSAKIVTVWTVLAVMFLVGALIWVPRPSPPPTPLRIAEPEPAEIMMIHGAAQPKIVEIPLSGVSPQRPAKLDVAGLPDGLTLNLPSNAIVESPVHGELRADRDVPPGTSRLDITVIQGENRDSATLTVHVPWLPKTAPFEPSGSAEVEKVGDAYFYSAVDRLLPEESRVRFVLIAEGPKAPFYMMETKVWQGIFATFAQANPDAVASDAWQHWPNDRLPVVNVTYEEAYACARWLGGNLPTPIQWDQAAGFYVREGGQPAQWKGGRWQWPDGPFRGTWNHDDPPQIAIDREQPMEVGEAEDDRSPFGCRGMAGNGKEFTRAIETIAGKRWLQPPENPQGDEVVILRGQGYGAQRPWIYERDPFDDGFQNFSDRKPTTGFRVVLEPPD